ncbi:Na+/H+ antiporter NhaC family protein [Butyricicoccus intestinisimiae]|uniref:Na+/H+ antiporter NhaC family protein n=1 Tax=Butyricicoccus intestinisimiae TaxID=2841509 RepID=A0ABS6EMZ1_9FIRM|nr:Na+/H+ antiporter NhaC family protein [Butyricicoccus intestinisimiae]MBU5489062.1 Na+/H+ antiporter NhaC family protein [Butyricicoccus intestinisimiae]
MKGNMRKKKTILKRSILTLIAVVCVVLLVIARQAGDVTGTAWALMPPIVAITLALLTKEVYSSLFAGIVVGGVLFSGCSFEGTVTHVLEDGFLSVLSDSGNVGILIFLILLGTIVALMNNAGGSAAFGEWAKSHIKTKAGAQLATILLGILIFIDDYFNCLTVGSVMRPVTDGHNVSRAKLAFLIDATAAPVCIISPISSWAAAVCGFVDGEDGMNLFVSAIPYNFYAILMVVLMVGMVLAKVEFGPMELHERNAERGDLLSNGSIRVQEDVTEKDGKKGSVADLVIPIISLVICCVIGMIYTGGFFSGADFVTAFSNSSASVGLSMGSFFGLVITILLYQVRGVLSFRDCMDCLSEGFKAMVPAILILSFAWTLKAMTDSIGCKEFVAGSMKLVAGDLQMFLPAVIFLVGCFLAFATGTSWGTFGILIPIVVAVFEGTNHELMLISISACMAGAVCGDHCSPISDTTIMASAGAQCDHMNHVSTQLPYAVLTAVVSCAAYVLAGFVQSAWIALPIAIVSIVLIILLLRFVQASNRKREEELKEVH